MFLLQIRHSGVLQSEGLPHYPLEVNTTFEQKNSIKNKPTEEKLSPRWASWLVGDLQLPTAVDDIGVQSVQCLDFRVSAAFAKIQGGNVP